MATIYRKTYPIPMPPGAEIVTRRGQRLARWTDGNGNEKTAPVTAGGKKILHEAGCWYARYKDADGIARRISTGCNDEQAARRVLSDLRADVEKVRSGILTPAESHAAGHVARPVGEHITDYLAFLKAKTVRGRKLSDSHRYNAEKLLKRLFQECGIKRIGDISRHRMVKWLGDQTDRSEKAPRTVLKYRTTLMTFCKWALREGRLAANPLVELPGVAVDEDRRRRRALTMDEIAALLDATTMRPLRDSLLIRRGKRKGQEGAKVGQAVQERLVRLGRERALIYKTLIYTGLRKNELATLTVADMHLESERPYAQLAGKNAKNGKGAMIPLRADLVQDLREHLDEKLTQYRCQGRQTEIPAALPCDTKVLDVPDDLIRIFDRDIALAGIPKTDADGRTLDVHSLRHTFATLLSKAGVLPRMAQELMRHSDIRLTMNTYTHLQLIDTAAAVQTLPSIGHEAGRQLPTGTNG